MARKTKKSPIAEEAFFDGHVVEKISILIFSTAVLGVFVGGTLWAITSWGWLLGVTGGALLSAFPAFGLFLIGLDSSVFRKSISGVLIAILFAFLSLDWLFPPT